MTYCEHEYAFCEYMITSKGKEYTDLPSYYCSVGGCNCPYEKDDEEGEI